MATRQRFVSIRQPVICSGADGKIGRQQVGTNGTTASEAEADNFMTGSPDVESGDHKP